MGGRHEKEVMLDGRIKKNIEDKPEIFTEYYYSLIGSGKSYDTAYRYINAILEFSQFVFGSKLEDNFYENVKSVHVNKYITALRTKDVNGKVKRTSDSIKTVKWSAINSFFQFLVPEYLDDNPVTNTQRPKMKDNPEVTYLTPEEISGLLNNVNKLARIEVKNRDLCILKLGFSTGLRISAIVQIDIDDIDFQNNRIRVTEKGDYDKYIMFGDNLKQQLKLWIADRTKYFVGCNTNALFVSQKRSRISTIRVADMLAQYANGVTDKHVTPHVMRHSCATNLYEQTKDIYLCSKQLSHKNVSTTQRYAELSNARQKEAANILDNLI